MTREEINRAARERSDGYDGRDPFDWWANFAIEQVNAALGEAAQIALNEPRTWEADAPDPQHRIADRIRALKIA